jgi:hypothetical protein
MLVAPDEIRGSDNETMYSEPRRGDILMQNGKTGLGKKFSKQDEKRTEP